MTNEKLPINVTLLFCSKSAEEADRKRKTYKDCDDFGILSMDGELYAVVPNSVLKLLMGDTDVQL